MVAYVSWFNRIRSGALNKGININGVIHKARPVPEGKGFKKAECPKCQSKNGFIFQSEQDKNIYILFCQKCGKYTLRKAGNKTPEQAPAPEGPKCKCGRPLPDDRKQFCYVCRPNKKKPPF